MVPIVFISMEKGSTCQQTPEHGNKMYERGGTCTSVQPYITGSRAVFSKILTKSHDILQVYEPEGPPCLSRTVKRGSRIENREWGLSSQVGKIDENGRQVQNRVEVSMFKYFLLLPNDCIFPSKIKCNKLQSIVKRN